MSLLSIYALSIRFRQNDFEQDMEENNDQIETQSLGDLYSEEVETQSQATPTVALGKKRGRPIKKGKRTGRMKKSTYLLSFGGSMNASSIRSTKYT